MTSALYPYSLASAPTDRTRYAYSPFIGEVFLDAWRKDRSDALVKLGSPGVPPGTDDCRPDPCLNGGSVDEVLAYIWVALCAESEYAGLTRKLVERLLQRFEVSLRLHAQIDKNFRPVDRMVFASPSAHLRLGEIFSELYFRTRDLRFLSALSKLIDGLLASPIEWTDCQSPRLANMIRREMEYVDSLIESPLPSNHSPVNQRYQTPTPHKDEFSVERQLDGVFILAARTARSQAYVQAIAEAKIRPHGVIIYGTRQSGLLGQRNPTTQTADFLDRINGLFLPDLGETIEQTANQAGWEVITVPNDDVNSSDLITRLRRCNPKLTLFSGYGGQIVGNEMLAISPFIHAHAGRLPAYRGSTTIYYSWLAENSCSVTAFLLSNQLDGGSILHHKNYSPPPRSLDVDYVYDSAIRADCLVEVLAEIARVGKLVPLEGQSDSEAESRLYFIIHPLLKHVARIKQKERQINE